MTLTKEQLTTPRLREQEVPIEGLGTIRIRSLSRKEVLGLKQFDGSEFEQRLVSLGMVEPAMTPEDVDAWQAASLSDELEQVTREISRVSGMAKGAAKEAYKSV